LLFCSLAQPGIVLNSRCRAVPCTEEQAVRTFRSTYQVVHVNAEFANQASDHDPQVVDIKP
jgi:hypothetical protein